jgi:putative transcriptional regulator
MNAVVLVLIIGTYTSFINYYILTNDVCGHILSLGPQSLASCWSESEVRPCVCLKRKHRSARVPFSKTSRRSQSEEAPLAIVVNLDLLLVRRKMKLTELASRVDITLANLSILKQNKARAVRFSTLEALCRELGCQPGDLLEYQPGLPETTEHTPPERPDSM